MPLPILLRGDHLGGSASYQAKSVIFDIATCWNTTVYMGVRAIDFWVDGAKITMIPTTNYVSYHTSKASNSFLAKYAFDTTLSKVGAGGLVSWLSGGATTNQRIIIVFNVLTTFDDIKINNYHESGAVTSYGLRAVKIYTSTDAITSTVYGQAIANSVLIFDDELTIHVASNQEDEQTLLLV